jgi:putative MATE family efflux protein
MATRDLTAGPIPKHLLSLWLPMLAAMTLQSLYALVNLIFVSQIGDAAISGLSITVQAFFIILAIGQVLGQTALSDIAQAYGRGDLETARRSLSSYVILSVILGVPASFAAWFGAESYVGLFTDDPEILREGIAYFEANAATFLLQLVIIVLSTAVRASGDFVTPMRIMAVSVLLNAALDPILMFTFDMGIAGAAWATVIAQALSCLTYAWRLSHRDSDPRMLRWGRPLWSRDLLTRVITRGLPAGIQFFLIFVLLGVILAGMKPFGGEWTGAAGGGFRVLQQTWLPLVTLASAAAALGGQNFGARQSDRVRETSRTALRWGLIYGTSAMCVVLLIAPWLSHLAGKSDLQLAHATSYFHWSAPMLVAFALTYIPTFVLQATGHSFMPMVAAIVRVGLVAAFTFFAVPRFGLGPESILIASTVASFIEGLLGWWLLRRFLARLDSREPTENARVAPAA